MGWRSKTTLSCPLLKSYSNREIHIKYAKGLRIHDDAITCSVKYRSHLLCTRIFASAQRRFHTCCRTFVFFALQDPYIVRNLFGYNAVLTRKKNPARGGRKNRKLPALDRGERGLWCTY